MIRCAKRRSMFACQQFCYSATITTNPKSTFIVLILFASIINDTLCISSCQCYVTSRKILFHVNNVRGGGNDSESRIEPHEVTPSNSSDIDNDTQQTNTRFWPSLFELADDIKSTVSSGIDIDASDGKSAVESGRGGALVKEKRVPRWLAPFDISRVSPFNARLLEDRVNQQLSTSSDSHFSQTRSTGDSNIGLAQNIWVDTWIDNMPDETSISKEGKSSSNLAKSAESESIDDAIREPILEISDEDIKSGKSDDETLASSEPTSNEVDIATPLNEIQIDESEVTTPDTSIVKFNLQSDLGVSTGQSPIDRTNSGYIRSVRKAAAKATGMHGFISGKYRTEKRELSTLEDKELQARRIRRRLEAIDRAKSNLNRLSQLAAARNKKQLFTWGRPAAERTGSLSDDFPGSTSATPNKEVLAEEQRRRDRVREINRQVMMGQQRLFELLSEKDILQRRPNPLWNYSSVEADRVMHLNNTAVNEKLVFTSRQFNFPPPDLVEDYLEMLISSGRLTKMNHTDLWQNVALDDDDDEDEFAMPGIYNSDIRQKKTINSNGDSQSGSWFLRNGLGERIGETAESNAYKAVCQSVMSILARSISSLHGLNLMGFSDIRLGMEQTPKLPPVSALLPGANMNGNYAKETVHEIVQRGAKKRSKKRNKGRLKTYVSFIQRDAVVETLLSQCQIAAPLLKWFPLAWQRAIIANIITLVTAIISDFCEGIEFQILGHRLSFSFSPITEDDVLRGLVQENYKNKQRSNPESFEAAVQATAADVGRNLKFLDRWHERALGSDTLRSQIATLIARLVLTLVDDILQGAKISLWTASAGGPRLTAGLEYHPDAAAQVHNQR